jgi:hypothetical protein
MFERLGARDKLNTVHLKAVENSRKLLLADKVKTPVKAEPEPEPEPITTVESSCDRHIAAMLSRPAKTPNSKKSRVSATLTQDVYPRLPHVARQGCIPASYQKIFQQMRMDGPGVRCTKKHGNVLAARLRQYLTQNELVGRAIVQYWEDCDMVFWVNPSF